MSRRRASPTDLLTTGSACTGRESHCQNECGAQPSYAGPAMLIQLSMIRL